MLKLGICILLFLGTQTYFLPHRLGQLSSSDFDLFKIPFYPFYKKYDYQGFVRDLKTQGTKVDKKNDDLKWTRLKKNDDGYGKMILDDGYGNIRLL